MKRTSQLPYIVGIAVIAIFVSGSAFAGHLDITVSDVLTLKSGVDEPVTAVALRFDLSSIPEGAQIDLAELRVGVSTDTSFGRAVEVYGWAVTESWTASPLASSELLDVNEDLSAFGLVTTGISGQLEMNITRIVSRWFAGTLTNNGIAVSIPDNTEHALGTVEDDNGRVAYLSVYYSMPR